MRMKKRATSALVASSLLAGLGLVVSRASAATALTPARAPSEVEVVLVDDGDPVPATPAYAAYVLGVFATGVVVGVVQAALEGERAPPPRKEDDDGDTTTTGAMQRQGLSMQILLD
jgi:hypothetical protein